MSFKKLLAAAFVAATLPFTASAATFAPGVYDAVDYSNTDVRSVWTGSHLVTGTGVSNKWTVGDTSKFKYNGTDAILTGTATNIGSVGGALAFDFVLHMTNAAPGTMPYCRPAICNVADESMWALFELTSASFTGLAGTAMAGIVYEVTQRSKHGPQAGVGANDKDATENGFSMWFDFVRTDTTDTSGSPFTFRSSGYGDFNMDLVGDGGGNIPNVPLPAGGLLLLGGLGALAAARRKAKLA